MIRFRKLVTMVLASAPAWVACSSDEPAAPPAPVVLTGSWTGIIDVTGQGGDLCPLDPTITEDTNGNVTGTADLQPPCGVVSMTVDGTNNTGGVPDSVELTFVAGGGGPGSTFIFNGNFDGVDAMSGLINMGGCNNCPTSFTR